MAHTNHPARRLLAISIAFAALISSAGPVAADTQVVRVAGCFYDGTGEMTVPAGDITLSWGVETVTKAQAQQYLAGIREVVVIDGTAVNNPLRYWGKPYMDSGYWVAFWTYAYGSLAAGDSLTVTLQDVARHKLTDGWDVFPAGTVWGGTCTITITAV